MGFIISVIILVIMAMLFAFVPKSKLIAYFNSLWFRKLAWAFTLVVLYISLCLLYFNTQFGLTPDSPLASFCDILFYGPLVVSFILGLEGWDTIAITVLAVEVLMLTLLFYYLIPNKWIGNGSPEKPKSKG